MIPSKHSSDTINATHTQSPTSDKPLEDSPQGNINGLSWTVGAYVVACVVAAILFVIFIIKRWCFCDQAPNRQDPLRDPPLEPPQDGTSQSPDMQLDRMSRRADSQSSQPIRGQAALSTAS